MTNSPKHTETLVGFFLFLGLGVLGTLIMQYGRFAERFRGVYTVRVSFSDASGLIKGSQVRLAGAQVGRVVKEPKLTDDGRVVVEMAIREDTPKLDTKSIIQISSLSLLGDKAIMITPPKPGEERNGDYFEDLGPNDVIEGGGPSGLEALQGDAETIASNAAVLMARGRNTLSKIDNALDELRSVTGLLTESIDRVNSGILADENMENFTGALADLRDATGSIRDASMDIKPLIGDAKLAIKSFDQAAEEAQGTFAQASSEISRLGPAIEKVPRAVNSIAEAADEVAQAASDASDTIRSVKNGDGLLGTLAYDREVKDDAKGFIRNLRHYGILRYRDAATFDERDPRNRFRGRRR